MKRDSKRWIYLLAILVLVVSVWVSLRPSPSPVRAGELRNDGDNGSCVPPVVGGVFRDCAGDGIPAPPGGGDDGGGGGGTPMPPPGDDGGGRGNGGGGQGGGNGGGEPTVQPTQPPAPTPTPPTGLPPDGHYVRACIVSGPDAIVPGCPSQRAVVDWWVVGDRWYFVGGRCAAEGECGPIPTPTPRPTEPPPPPDKYPCEEAPTLGGGGLTQTCDDYAWALYVEVRIPPAKLLRNPWPRSLVALPTNIWYLGEPNRVEAFSEGKAFPCAVDYGAVYHSEAELPTCPDPVGKVSEGARVNLQLGAAWQRWRDGDPPLFGFRPPYEAMLSIPSSPYCHSEGCSPGGNFEFSRLLRDGYHATYTFETSSWGLTENGPTWNPECQERDCSCDERVQGWDTPAYQAGFTTWWWPQYTWKYDELRCTGRGWSDCFYRAEEPLGQPHTTCDYDGDGVDDPGYWRIEVCQSWKWVSVTEPWVDYDLRPLGYTPLIPWAGVETAGATPEGVQCGRFYPGAAIPVIELQSILEP